VKPHPLERDLDGYRRIDGLDVIEGRRGFYELLGNYHIHCSVYSTTLLESVGLGVPTMILGLPGSENSLPMTERGFCKVAGSPREFADILHEAAGDREMLSKWHRDTRAGRDYFWTPGAGENIRTLIADVVGGKTDVNGSQR
jgi:hypothetical protein